LRPPAWVVAMSKLTPPHGGNQLRPLLIDDSTARSELIEQAESLPSVIVSSKEASDLVMLATGAFTPLEGFMGLADYDSVLTEMRLANRVLWPIPVTLAVGKGKADQFGEGDSLALACQDSGQILAVMELREKFSPDKSREAQAVFGTTDDAHPGVRSVRRQGEVYLAGPVRALSEGRYPLKFPEFARPSETRRIFTERGWSTVAAFQTRNPIHRSHEYLTKVALEICDGLLIHPIVGKLKEGDIPAEVRMDCYRAMIDRYYPPERVVLKVYPMEMRYAGPREAILHAIIRQNFGCSHLIVGRDHAGVGDYYRPFDAQDIFDSLEPEDLQLKPIKMDWAFWCKKCKCMVSSRTCPHDGEDRLMISGTQLREMLSQGVRPPEQFTRPEVTDILLDHYSAR